MWLLIATLVAASDAEAAVSLTWATPDDCPSHARVLAEVERLSGRSLLVGAPLVVTATVTQHPEWQVAVAIGAGEQRVFGAASCDELAGAVALMVSLALRERAPVVPAPTAAVVSSTAAPARLSFSAGAEVFGDSGSLPGVTAGVAVGARARVSVVSLGVGVAYWWPVEASSAAVAGGGARISLLAARTDLCWHHALAAAIELAACAGAELGAMSGSGFGVANVRNGSSAWVAPVARVSAAWSVRPGLAFSLGLEGIAPAVRPRFVLDDAGQVHQPAPVIAHVGVGMELSL